MLVWNCLKYEVKLLRYEDLVKLDQLRIDNIIGILKYND